MSTTVDCAGAQYVAWWRDDAQTLLAYDTAPSYEAAIRAATCKLLGIDAAAARPKGDDHD